MVNRRIQAFIDDAILSDIIDAATGDRLRHLPIAQSGVAEALRESMVNFVWFLAAALILSGVMLVLIDVGQTQGEAFAGLIGIFASVTI